MKAELAFKSLVAVVCIGMMLPAMDGLAQGTPSASPGTAKVCPVTLPGPEVYNVGNFGTAEQTVELPPGGVFIQTPNDGSPPGGPYSEKFFWRRWVEGTFTITGQRLDAPAGPVTAQVPKGNGSLPTVLTFPTTGCWEVTGHVGESSLTFVAIVIDVSKPTASSTSATPTPAASPTS